MADQAGRPADWEMAKENIQPLKQGRKMAKLANCLQVRLHRGFRARRVADPLKQGRKMAKLANCLQVRCGSVTLLSGSGSLFSLLSGSGSAYIL